MKFFLLAMGQWFEEHPERVKSDEYYRRRLLRSEALTIEEQALSSWLVRNRRGKLGCEIGCGFAQLSASVNGAIKMTAVDGDLNRMLGAHAIKKMIGGEYELVHGYFPEAVRERRFDFCVATNLVNSWWDAQSESECDRWRAMLSVTDELIFDAALWFKNRDGAMQEALIDDLREWGFGTRHVIGTFWAVRK